MANATSNTLHNLGWEDVLSNIDPFALANLGSALALTLCVIGAAWCVCTSWECSLQWQCLYLSLARGWPARVPLPRSRVSAEGCAPRRAVIVGTSLLGAALRNGTDALCGERACSKCCPLFTLPTL